MQETNYYDIKAISNSSLSWLKESPKTFKENMNNRTEERESKSLKSGKLIHSFILEPDSFAVSNVTPVDGLMGKFIEEVVNIEQHGTIEEIERRYEAAYSCAGFKLSPEVVFRNFNKEVNQDFYKFLLNTEGKICLSEPDFNMINNCKSNLVNHKKANSLLFNDFILKSNNRILVEETISFELDGIKCKAKPDKVIINDETKTVILIDLKTTSKSLNKFSDSYNNYEYGRQLAWYEQGLKISLNLHDYKFRYYIIAVQTNKFNEVAVFAISNKQIDKGRLQYQQLFDLYKQHLKYGFDYPIEYYLSDGAVELREEEYDKSEINNEV